MTDVYLEVEPENESGKGPHVRADSSKRLPLSLFPAIIFDESSRREVERQTYEETPRET